MTLSEPRVLLRSLFDAAVAAADPAVVNQVLVQEQPRAAEKGGAR